MKGGKSALYVYTISLVSSAKRKQVIQNDDPAIVAPTFFYVARWKNCLHLQLMQLSGYCEKSVLFQGNDAFDIGLLFKFIMSMLVILAVHYITPNKLHEHLRIMATD